MNQLMLPAWWLVRCTSPDSYRNCAKTLACPISIQSPAWAWTPVMGVAAGCHEVPDASRGS